MQIFTKRKRVALLLALTMLMFGVVSYAQTSVTLPAACANCTSGSTNGSAVVSNYGNSTCANPSAGTINGTLTQGVAASGVTMTLYANVTQIGSWNIMTIASNGVIFSGSGTFTSLGCLPITLTASGTPTTAGPLTVNTNTTPVGTASTTVAPSTEPSSNGTAVVSAFGGIGCTGNGILNGTYTVGQAVTSSNTLTFYANVTQIGTWNITTAANNGVTFSGSGTFTSTGCQTITLTASGTPTTAGTLIAVTNTSPTGTASANVSDPSSNGTAVVSNYGNSTCANPSSGTINGSMTQGVAVSGVTMTLYANVTQVGSWSLSAVQNGVTFTGSGTFTSTGCQPITLNASGTPTASGPFTWCTNSTPPGCAPGIVVEPSTNGTGIVSIFGGPGCTGSGAINGTLTQGVAASGVTMTLYANVTKLGTWNLEATENGVTFSGSGTFTTLGCQMITLNAAGTPLASGSFTWNTDTVPVGSGTLTVGGGASGSGSLTFSWETDLRFKQYANIEANASNAFMSGGVTKDGKVFCWGRDSFGNIDGDAVNNGTAGIKGSPVFMDGAGKWGTNAAKIQIGNDAFFVLDNSGNIWAWGSQERGQLGDGVNGGSVTERRIFANANNMAKPTGVTSFTDIVARFTTTFVLGNNGRVYFFGNNPSTSAATPTATVMALPSGVTSITKIWGGNNGSLNSLFMLGNDGELYSFVSNRILTGNSTVATSASAHSPLTPVKVNLPTGEAAKVIKVDADVRSVYALTSDGNIYTWGTVRFDYGANPGPLYGMRLEGVLEDQTNVTIVTNGSGHRTYFAYNPKKLKLPTGETKFIDVTAANRTSHFICESGNGYVLGYEEYIGEGGSLGADNDSQISWVDYQKMYAIEGISVKNISSDGYASLVLDTDGKLWGFGDNRFCMTGAGFSCPQYISTALPLMNGNVDSRNPRPQTVN